MIIELNSDKEDAAVQYFVDNWDTIKAQYNGSNVAIRDGEIVGSGLDMDALGDSIECDLVIDATQETRDSFVAMGTIPKR
ncbi:MAG: hypothetical protein ABII07_04500 [Patescibacteria group bacterium]|nr:hypothetical protein [Patescibacteria group bacterium]